MPGQKLPFLLTPYGKIDSSCGLDLAAHYSKRKSLPNKKLNWHVNGNAASGLLQGLMGC